MTPPCVLIPLRPFDEGKQRLRAALDEPARIAATRSWATRGVRAAATVVGERHVHVCGRGTVEAFARELGVVHLPEPDRAGLAPVCDAALAALAARGYGRALVLMPDLPDVDVSDLVRLLGDASDVVLAESRSGHGTNALVLSLPARFALSLGDPESAARHARSAADAGLGIVRVRYASLLRDVDVPADLSDDPHPG